MSNIDFQNIDPVAIAEATQRLRLKALAELTENGTKIGDLKEFLHLTRELDSTALLSRKLNIEEAEKDEASQIARDMIALMSSGVVAPVPIKDIEGEVIKPDMSRLPKPKLVPGHLDLESPELNINDFYQQKKAE